MLNSLYIGNRDGGIINTITQAPQSSEPVVIIGLGGTGVDAIARLKTKLKRQIKPDNEDAVRNNGDEPQYDHIKFLGIDADRKWLENSGLTYGEETLNIQNYNYNDIFSDDKIDALKDQREMQWMSIDYMSRHLPPKPDGAGAYRQFGRWLTIASASNIKMRLTQVIREACTDQNGGQLIVHIVSSISGGMGAGSFADVCYIARDVIDGFGFTAAKVFGYFVLPDAIISKKEIIGDPTKTAANQKNGIASLLEIEHLMNLKDSNEWFEQDYGAFAIRTQHKLVDMCHFVSAMNTNGVPVKNGYEYALNVIGDYIIAFISREQVANGASPITMTGNLTNIDAILSGINPDHGYSQNYHLIGSANGEIPTTQMATYLATELFGRLTIRREMPNNIQIEQEFADYLKLSDSRFKQLENQIAQGAGWSQITERLVSQYFDQIKAHMNDNILPIAMINPTESSLRQRKGLLIQKRESMEKNVETYVYQAGASSIPGLALNKLIQIAEDPAKGPIYAYGMMNKTGADIFHYLDGRKNYYEAQKQKARDEEASFTNLEPAAKQELGNSGFWAKKDNIKKYAETLNSIYYWQSQADLFEEMEILMADLMTAFRSMNNEYLRPLYNITMELIETFEANGTYFHMGNGDTSQDGFTVQLVPFSKIQPELHAQIERLDSAAETRGLLKILTEYPETWMEHEESKLKAKISEYVLNKFNPILSGSLESFLRKYLNMQSVGNAAFANAIKNSIIGPFVNKAAPIFWTSEPVVSNPNKTSHRSILTVPSAANCICAAANTYKSATNAVNPNDIEVRMSLINDRIYILSTISGVPMYAYQGLVQYLGAYKNYSELGLHLYEHNVDWREILTFPYPYSRVSKYTKNANELLNLYNEAEAKGIIYFRSGTAYVKRFDEIDPELLNIEGLRVNGRIDMNMVTQRISDLNAILDTSVEPIMINSKGNEQPGNKIVKDNFLRFYGIQQAVRKEVEKYNSVKKTIADIEKIVSDTNRSNDLRKVFFDAVFVGLFDDDGFNISYKYVQLGMDKIAILCDNSMPYSGLSKYYQAFNSMLTLDSAVQKKISDDANDKFNSMTREKKEDRVGQLMSMYTPEVLAMISQNYIGRLEQKEIEGFYASFVYYVRQIGIIVRMSGASE